MDEEEECSSSDDARERRNANRKVDEPQLPLAEAVPDQQEEPPKQKVLDLMQGEDENCLEIRKALGLPSYADLVVSRWDKCKAETADILIDPAPRKGWRNTAAKACMIHPNAVHGSAHKRMLHRMLKAAAGSTEPLRKEVEQECTPPPEIPAQLAGLGSEVILTVSVYSTDGHKDQEYDILSTQTLQDLRDAIYFVDDWTYDGPSRLDSACFFIDGVFYSDMRLESAIDYAASLIPYIQATGCQELKATSSRSMCARFCDLARIPFGERCAYIRQGNCEHAMYFTGARLPCKDSDCPLVDGYPLLTWMKSHHRTLCHACVQNLAFWCVHNSSRCPRNPAKICQLCFRHFFLTADGQLKYPVDYSLFPYLHNA